MKRIHVIRYEINSWLIMKALVCWNVTWLDSVTIKISYAINRFSVIIFYNGIKIIISAAIGKYFYGHRCYGVSSNDQIIAIQGIKCSLINDTSRWWSSGRIALPIKLRFENFTHGVEAIRVMSCHITQIYQFTIKKVEFNVCLGVV